MRTETGGSEHACNHRPKKQEYESDGHKLKINRHSPLPVFHTISVGLRACGVKTQAKEIVTVCIFKWLTMFVAVFQDLSSGTAAGFRFKKGGLRLPRAPSYSLLE